MDYDYYKNLFERLDETELTSWLSDPINTENYYVEYKVAFYNSTEEERRECRKDYAAFANKWGGFIFFGVSNQLQIAGIRKNTELAKHISDKLSPYRGKVQWNILNAIPLSTGRFVYIIAIRSIRNYWEKPLISDGRIFIRDNGCITEVQDISELENWLNFRDFVPKDIRYFEDLLSSRASDLDSWVKGTIPLPIYYARIIAECGVFINRHKELAINDALKLQTEHVSKLFVTWSNALKVTNINPLLVNESGMVNNPEESNNGIREKLIIFIAEFKNIFLNE